MGTHLSWQQSPSSPWEAAFLQKAFKHPALTSRNQNCCLGETGEVGEPSISFSSAWGIPRPRQPFHPGPRIALSPAPLSWQEMKPRVLRCHRLPAQPGMPHHLLPLSASENHISSPHLHPFGCPGSGEDNQNEEILKGASSRASLAPCRSAERSPQRSAGQTGLVCARTCHLLPGPGPVVGDKNS